MTRLDDLFAASYAEQSRAADGVDLEAVLGGVVAGATRRRRTRALVNGGLTVVASALLAGAAWATLHTPTPPAEQPEPALTLAQALPEPSLVPVWDGGLVPLEQDVPVAFTDSFSRGGLTLAESPGRNFPHAFEMEDRLWDEVGPGWSLQTWQAEGEPAPVYLYLASPGGTYFLVRELDEFAGRESWDIESWSARPAVAVIGGQDEEQWVSARRLIDLRTGDTLRAWGATGGDSVAYADTVLASGFADGASLRADFTREGGFWEDDGEASPTDVRLVILHADGSTHTVTGDAWTGGVPRITGLGGDGHTALVTDADGNVLVVDLDAATARGVTLAFPTDQTCNEPALTTSGDIVAYCYLPEDLTNFATIFDTSTGAVRESRALDVSPLEEQGFHWEDGTITDLATSEVVDLTRTPTLAQYFTFLPMAQGQFAIVDANYPAGRQLVLYDRASGATYAVLGDTVPGSRAAPAVQSVAVLTEVVPGESGLIMGGSS